MTRPYKKRRQSPERIEIVAAMKEQAEFARREKEHRHARMIEAARSNPTLSAAALAERFNCTEMSMLTFLSRHGISRSRFADEVSRDEARALPAGEFDLGWRGRGAA